MTSLADMRRELHEKFEKLRFQTYFFTNPEEEEMIEEWKSIIRDLAGRLPLELKIETKRGGWTATYFPPDTIGFRPDVWKKLTLDEKRLTVLHELFHYFDIPRRVDLRHFEFAPLVDIVLRKLDYPIPEEYQRKAEKIIRILRGEAE